MSVVVLPAVIEGDQARALRERPAADHLVPEFAKRRHVKVRAQESEVLFESRCLDDDSRVRIRLVPVFPVDDAVIHQHDGAVSQPNPQQQVQRPHEVEHPRQRRADP